MSDFGFCLDSSFREDPQSLICERSEITSQERDNACFSDSDFLDQDYFTSEFLEPRKASFLTTQLSYRISKFAFGGHSTASARSIWERTPWIPLVSPFALGGCGKKSEAPPPKETPSTKDSLQKTGPKMDEGMKHLFKALEYRKKGKMKDFKREIKIVIQFFPKDMMAYDILAKTYIGEGDLEAAEKLYKKAISLNPNNIKTINYLVNFYLQLGNLANAKIYLKKMLRINPNDLYTRAMLGFVQVNLKEYGAAKLNAEKILQKEPNAQIGIYILAIVNIAEGKWSLGKKGLLQVIKIDPTNAVAKKAKVDLKTLEEVMKIEKVQKNQ